MRLLGWMLLKNAGIIDLLRTRLRKVKSCEIKKDQCTGYKGKVIRPPDCSGMG